MSTTELVPSVSIANMVNQRAAALDRIERAIQLIQEASEIAEAAHLGMPTFSACNGYARHSSDVSLNSGTWGQDRNGPRPGIGHSGRDNIRALVVKGIDCGAWQYLMSQSGLRSLMDATARTKWDKAVADGEVPELTDANIRSTFKMLHDSRGEMFERGVIACFKSLAWDYKTNLPQKFGKRIVVTYLLGSYSTFSKTDQLDDLVRVMSVLDGKPEPDSRRGIYMALSAAGLNGWPHKAGVVETEYLSIRTFKNQNGHVTFKRPDLVDKMNRIIAKHYPGALPAPK